MEDSRSDEEKLEAYGTLRSETAGEWIMLKDRQYIMRVMVEEAFADD
jgi:hypothetical protein